MAIDKNKIQELANKYLAKGQLDKAIVEYYRLVEDDPSDVRTWLKIGDLHARAGQLRESINTYLKVAERYTEQGFFYKAIAVYKQILKLDAGRLDVLLQLAQVYEHLTLHRDATKVYEVLATEYSKRGDELRMLDVLGRLCELDPTNIPYRIRFAESLSQAQRTEDAANAFQISAELLKELGRTDDYARVLERLLFHRPDDLVKTLELAEYYLAQNEPKRALTRLQACIKSNPRDTSTLMLLAQAFLTLGQTAKAVWVYHELARIHGEAGLFEEQKRALDRVLLLEPNNSEARKLLESHTPQPTQSISDSRIQASSYQSGARVSQQTQDFDDNDATAFLADSDIPILGTDDAAEVIEDDLIEVFADDLRSIPPEAQASDPVWTASEIPPGMSKAQAIEKLLAECDVFANYGLAPKVIQQLKRILALDPTVVEARLRLKDIYIQSGQIEAAQHELFMLAETAKIEQDVPAAVAYLREMLIFDPNNQQAKLTLESMGFSDAEVTHLEPSGAPQHDHWKRTPPPTRPSRTNVAERYQVAGMNALTTKQENTLTKTTIENEHPQDPTHVATSLRMGDSLRPSFRPVHERPKVEVEEGLDEAEFFISQGLFQEAQQILVDMLESYPRHPLIEEKLAEIRAHMAGIPIPEREEVSQSTFLTQELARALGARSDNPQEGTTDSLDVDSVFAQFRNGVQSQVKTEDAETHFDLGIAYKEMGLIDDAIHEFGLAALDPKRECSSNTMIGVCFVQKGVLTEAIKRFKRGLYAGIKTPQEELALYFELGSAYEQLADVREALYYFEKVYRRDPTFRDITAHIKKLEDARASGSRSGPLFTGETEDINQAFDALLLGDTER